MSEPRCDCGGRPDEIGGAGHRVGCAVNQAADPWQPPDWRANAGRILLDPNGPNGEPLATPLDRRWLWRLETLLAVNAPMGGILSSVGRDLGAYLNETCEHHWSASEAEPEIPAHRQCLWCCTVEWTNEAAR